MGREIPATLLFGGNHLSSNEMVSDERPIKSNATHSSQPFLLLSFPTYIFTRHIIVAPFGRHVPPKNHWWLGPKFNARWSWFLFECPNLIWSWYYSCILYQHQSSTKSGKCIVSTNVVLLCIFTLHYINRDIIYPLRMNPNSQQVPLLVTVAAGCITTWNGYLQCFYLENSRTDYPLSLSPSLGNLQRWTGIVLKAPQFLWDGTS